MSNFDHFQLSVLKDLLDDLFIDSKADRKKIHEMEWSEGESYYSILGNIELKSGELFGVLDRFLSEATEIDASLKPIFGRSLYEDEGVRSWLMKNGDEFKKYSRYVLCLEAFRVALNEKIFNKMLGQAVH